MRIGRRGSPGGWARGSALGHRALLHHRRHARLAHRHGGALLHGARLAAQLAGAWLRRPGSLLRRHGRSGTLFARRLWRGGRRVDRLHRAHGPVAQGAALQRLRRARALHLGHHGLARWAIAQRAACSTSGAWPAAPRAAHRRHVARVHQASRRQRRHAAIKTRPWSARVPMPVHLRARRLRLRARRQPRGGGGTTLACPADRAAGGWRRRSAARPRSPPN